MTRSAMPAEPPRSVWAALACGVLFWGASPISAASLRAQPDYLHDPGDKEWVRLGEQSRERAEDSSEMAKEAAERARVAANQVLGDLPPINDGDEALTEAEESLQDAIAYNKKAMALLPRVEAQAYGAGRAAASKEAQHVEREAQNYFQALLSNFNDLKVPKIDPKREAIIKAAQPYEDGTDMLKKLVRHYGKQFKVASSQARKLGTMAKSLATKAGQEQSAGQTDKAQQQMMQAHETAEVANEQRREALNVRYLAEQLNAAIPMYDQAKDMAALHAAGEWR